MTGFYLNGFCQIKEIIDRDVSKIRYIPDGNSFSKNWKKNARFNKKYLKTNREYHEILLLDTLAIPFLVDKISDTSEMNIHIPCSVHTLKAGDVAFSLLNNIIPIPMSLVTGSQWDSFSCDMLPDGTWDYLHDDRLKFQKELRSFFASHIGRAWVSLLKRHPNKAEAKTLIKELSQ